MDNRKTTFVLSLLLAIVVSAFVTYTVQGTPNQSEKKPKLTKMVIDVSSRMQLFTDTVSDEGPDFQLGTADDRKRGPVFFNPGVITKIDGKVTDGIYYCYGLCIFPDDLRPRMEGFDLAAKCFIIPGRGAIYINEVEGQNIDAPTGAIVGGTGEFARISGTLKLVSGSEFPHPFGAGNQTFELEYAKNK